MTQTSTLIAAWKQEGQAPFTGWDFSHLEGRMLEDQPPWSYTTRARELLRHSHSVLDMGTGGGERFLRILEGWHGKAAATEDYPPNLTLSSERLAPLGIRVWDVPLTDTDPMPFADGEFELVLNRHSGLNAKEVARILSAGGTFLTQQVHGLWAEDLIACFDTSPQWPSSTLEKYVPQLQAAGLTIQEGRDWTGKLGFTDVGAIVYYLKAVPWLVPGFSVESHLEALLELQSRLERGEELTFTARKYLIEARKARDLENDPLFLTRVERARQHLRKGQRIRLEDVEEGKLN